MKLSRRHLITAGAASAAGVVVTGSSVSAGPVGELEGTFTAPDGSIMDLSGTVTLSASSGVVDVLGATATPRFTFAGHVVLPFDYILTQDATVDSLYTNGHTLTIAPGVTLRSRGNIVNDSPIVIDGRSDPALTTTIEFIDVNEAAMVGSNVAGMQVVASDVGLWTVGLGTLQATGAPRRAWCRSAAGIAAGQSTFTADAPLDGWRVGDEVVVTPTASGQYVAHRSTVTAISGQSFTLATATTQTHPRVDVWGTLYGAEFLNLTRNVRIKGTPLKRAHTIFLHCSQPQHVEHVEYAHLGPIGPVANYMDPYPSLPLGRWAVHFHHGGAAVAGSTMVGCTAHDVGTHAFVPHLVDGVTFTDCVAHEVGLGGFWWDDTLAKARALGVPPSPSIGGDASTNITYDRCVASQVRRQPAWDGSWAEGALKAGFGLGNGSGSIPGCIASGVMTDWRFEGGAYSWQSNHSGTWATDGSIAHNSIKGVDLWNNHENTPLVHRGMKQYRCQRAFRDGAYRTTFGWDGVDVVGVFQSVAGKRTTQNPPNYVLAPDPDIIGLRVDAAGGQFAFLAAGHHRNFITDQLVVRVADSSFKGATKACAGFQDDGGLPHIYEFTDCTFVGNEFWLESNCPALSVITYRRTGQPTLMLRPQTFTGDTSAMTWSAAWNAWVQTV